MAAGTVDAAVGFAIILAAYAVKIRRVEGLLTKSFGEEYVRFKAEVPALVPAIRWRKKRDIADRGAHPEPMKAPLAPPGAQTAPTYALTE